MSKGLKLGDVAKALKVPQTTLSQALRFEWSDDQKAMVYAVIDEVANDHKRIQKA